MGRQASSKSKWSLWCPAAMVAPKPTYVALPLRSCTRFIIQQASSLPRHQLFGEDFRDALDLAGRVADDVDDLPIAVGGVRLAAFEDLRRAVVHGGGPLNDLNGALVHIFENVVGRASRLDLHGRLGRHDVASFAGLKHADVDARRPVAMRGDGVEVQRGRSGRQQRVFPLIGLAAGVAPLPVKSTSIFVVQRKP